MGVLLVELVSYDGKVGDHLELAVKLDVGECSQDACNFRKRRLEETFR